MLRFSENLFYFWRVSKVDEKRVVNVLGLAVGVRLSPLLIRGLSMC